MRTTQTRFTSHQSVLKSYTKPVQRARPSFLRRLPITPRRRPKKMTLFLAIYANCDWNDPRPSDQGGRAAGAWGSVPITLHRRAYTGSFWKQAKKLTKCEPLSISVAFRRREVFSDTTGTKDNLKMTHVPRRTPKLLFSLRAL